MAKSTIILHSSGAFRNCTFLFNTTICTTYYSYSLVLTILENKNGNKPLLQYSKWFTFAFQSIYGLLILSLLFIFHKEQVQEIIVNICQLQVPTTYFNLLFGIVLALFLSLCSVVYLQNKNQIQNILQECFYILLYAIIFKSSSLIWGFAIYFVIWHSIPSIMDQIRFFRWNLHYC